MHLGLPFLHLIFIGFLSLFPVVDPVGSAFIVDPLLSGLDLQERRRAAKKIALYCFGICIASTLIGSWMLRLFGISISTVRLAGGIMICHMGWLLLTDGDVKGKQEAAKPANRDNILFYPVAFPMTTGAGTISVILTLSAHEDEKDIFAHIVNLSAVFIASFLMCLLIYVCYANAPRLIQRIGPRGEQIVNRITAFLVFCIGIQIALSGILSLIKTL
jgi:multiple antibiotic resistance protein